MDCETKRIQGGKGRHLLAKDRHTQQHTRTHPQAGSPGVQVAKNPPAEAGHARGTGSALGQEDPPGREMATHPLSLPRESQGHGSLESHSPWGRRVDSAGAAEHARFGHPNT